jgi:hypothetical protein
MYNIQMAKGRERKKKTMRILLGDKNILHNEPADGWSSRPMSLYFCIINAAGLLFLLLRCIPMYGRRGWIDGWMYNRDHYSQYMLFLLIDKRNYFVKY